MPPAWWGRAGRPPPESPLSPPCRPLGPNRRRAGRPPPKSPLSPLLPALGFRRPGDARRGPTAKNRSHDRVALCFKSEGRRGDPSLSRSASHHQSPPRRAGDPPLSRPASHRRSPPVAGPCWPLGPDGLVAPVMAPHQRTGATIARLPVSNPRVAGATLPSLCQPTTTGVLTITGPYRPLSPDRLVAPIVAPWQGTGATTVQLPISNLRVTKGDPTLSRPASDHRSPSITGPCRPWGPDGLVAPVMAQRPGMGAATVRLPVSNMRDDPFFPCRPAIVGVPPSPALRSR